MSGLLFLVGLAMSGSLWTSMLVSAQTPVYYDRKATLSNTLIVQHPSAVSPAKLIITTNSKNRHIRMAYDAVVRDTLNIPKANITSTEITSATSTTCPGSSTPSSFVCSSVNIRFFIQYNTSSFPGGDPATAAGTAVNNAINKGKLQCRLVQRYPASTLKFITGGACSETSLPPTIAPTRAPTSRFTTTATASNNFFISHNSPNVISITSLNINGNAYRTELKKAYNSLLSKTIASFLDKGAIVNRISRLNVTDTSCPMGFSATCYIASAGFTLRYDPKDFPGMNPGLDASNLMQASINAGNLICEHKRLYPSSLLTVRSGNKCHTDTPPPTSSPTRASPIGKAVSIATIANVFTTTNTGGITTGALIDPSSSASANLLAAYISLVEARVNIYLSQGTLSYGDYKITKVSLVTCPTGYPSGSVCNSITAIFQLNYTASDFATEPATPISNFVQDAINQGQLDCELEKLTAALQIVRGCPATNPMVYDTTSTVSTGFQISNTKGITSTLLQQPGNIQKAGLAASYDAMISVVLRDFLARGAVIDGAATVDLFNTESSCLAGAICHFVTATFKLKSNRKDFSEGNVGQNALSLIVKAIGAGTFICYHTKVAPSSDLVIRSGVKCPTEI